MEVIVISVFEAEQTQYKLDFELHHHLTFSDIICIGD